MSTSFDHDRAQCSQEPHLPYACAGNVHDRKSKSSSKTPPGLALSRKTSTKPLSKSQPTSMSGRGLGSSLVHQEDPWKTRELTLPDGISLGLLVSVQG